MWNPQPLRAEIVRNGLTQGIVAKSIGMSENTFSTKLKYGTFGLDECAKIINLLGIKDPAGIFFPKA